MDFSEALKWLKNGDKVTRNSWEPYGQFVVLRKGYPRGVEINADTAEATGLPEGERRVFRPYLMLHCADLSFVPWQPTASDVLAGDWQCATVDGTISWPDGTVA